MARRLRNRRLKGGVCVWFRAGASQAKCPFGGISEGSNWRKERWLKILGVWREIDVLRVWKVGRAASLGISGRDGLFRRRSPAGK